MIKKLSRSLEQQYNAVQDLINLLKKLDFKNSELTKKYEELLNNLLHAKMLLNQEALSANDEQDLELIDYNLEKIAGEIDKLIPLFFEDKEVINTISPLLNLFSLNEKLKNVNSKK